MPETNARIKVCHDTAANFKTNNPTLLVGEWALETDTKKMKIGDGSTAYNALPYSTAEDSEEWQKPADWVDIRSGALDNSVYFLVGHSADYSQYPDFFVNATISNSGTYDVYVDGIKQATTASATATTLNWQTLALETGFDVTTPSNLRAHIVRVTPSVSTDTITKLTCDGSYTSPTNRSGLLWAHFTMTNEFNATALFGKSGGFRSDMLQTVTSVNGLLNVSRLETTFFNASSLIEIPTIASQSHPLNLFAWGCFQGCTNLKKVVFDKIVLDSASLNVFRYNHSLKRVEGVSVPLSSSGFEQNYALEKLPTIAMIGSSRANNFLTQSRKLGDTYLDLSWYNNCQALTVSGKSADYFIAGLKGLTVSNEAPFNYATSPQIDVSYTGLDRQALRQMFKSMPYNVGYTVVGSPTIVDGVASGFDADNYLTVSRPTLDTNDFEFKTCFTTNTISNQRIISTISGASQLTGFLINSSSLGARFYNGTESLAISSNTTLVANTKYYAIMYRQGTTIGLKLSTDNQTWENVTQTILATDSIVLSGNFGIGRSSQSTFLGSIDLNETYIKVNGVPWFTGKEAMTKTCNIVGCTGTAELTQEDKNIALDKGWELTVA